MCLGALLHQLFFRNRVFRLTVMEFFELGSGRKQSGTIQRQTQKQICPNTSDWNWQFTIDQHSQAQQVSVEASLMSLLEDEIYAIEATVRGEAIAQTNHSCSVFSFFLFWFIFCTSILARRKETKRMLCRSLLTASDSSGALTWNAKKRGKEIEIEEK